MAALQRPDMPFGSTQARSKLGLAAPSRRLPALSGRGTRIACPPRDVACAAWLPRLQEALLAPLAHLRLTAPPASLRGLWQALADVVAARGGAGDKAVEAGQNLQAAADARLLEPSLRAFAAALAAGKALPPRLLLPGENSSEGATADPLFGGINWNLDRGRRRLFRRFVEIRRRTRRITYNDRYEYSYNLSFDQHDGVAPPGELGGAALASVFLALIRLAGALPGPLPVARDLSREASVLVALFLLSRRALDDSLAAWEDETSGETPSLPALRAPFLGVVTRHVWAEHADDIMVAEEPGTVGDAVWVWSRTACAAPDNATSALLYVHGGGFVTGDFFGFRSYCYFLSRATGLPVLFSQYRRPPEHRLAEHSVEDVADCARLLARRGIRAAVVGDSAGGGLAMLAMQRLQAEHAAAVAGTARPLAESAVTAPTMPVAAVLFSPWVDLTCNAPTIESNVPGDVVLAPGMLRVGRDLALAGHAGERDCPSVSALFGTFEGLPPLLVSASSNELLFGDSVALAKAARADGVEVTEDTVHGLFHTYQLMYPYLPESCEAMDRIAEWLSAKLAADSTAPDRSRRVGGSPTLPARA